MSADFQARTRQFRTALGSFATGVTIVTTRNRAGEDIGLIAGRIKQFGRFVMLAPKGVAVAAAAAASMPIPKPRP